MGWAGSTSQWPEGWLDDMYKLLGRSFAFVLPAVFVIGAAEGQSDEVLKASLGRVTFFLLMLAISLFLWRMLRSVISGKEGSEAPRDGGSPKRFERFWALLALAVPLAIAVVSFLGYYYAALQLGLRLHATACLVIAVLILQGMILRWLLLARRRLAIEENEKRRGGLAVEDPGRGGGRGARAEGGARSGQGAGTDESPAPRNHRFCVVDRHLVDLGRSDLSLRDLERSGAVAHHPAGVPDGHGC